LLNTLPIVALLFVISKFVKQIAWKSIALAAMRKPFALATIFHRASITPKGLVDVNTARTIHFFPICTFAAQNTAS